MINADTEFMTGFQIAAKLFEGGLTVEQVMAQVQDPYPKECQKGAQGWADLFLGWVSTPNARRAEKLGLKVEE